MQRKTWIVGLLIIASIMVGGVMADGVQWEASPGVEIESEDGPSVKLNTDVYAESSEPVPDDNTVDLSPHAVFESDSPSTLHIDSIDPLEISSISGDPLTVSDIYDTSSIEVDGIDSMLLRPVDLESDGSEIEVSGSGTITITGYENQPVYVQRSSGTDRIFDGEPIDLTIDGSDEISLLETNDPKLSNLYPTDDKISTDNPVELSVDVDDPDFDTEDGDEVEITFYDGDNGIISSETITSQSNVSVEFEDALAGFNDWYVIAEDKYGNSVQSDTETFAVPDSIEIRNESNAEELISEDADATVTFFGGDEVFERDVEDGTVDMAGLPTEEFVISVQADGYVTRQAIIDSILEQQTVYMLDENADSSEVVFTLADDTSRFPSSDTTLYIERPITRDGSTTYEVVTADEFGANDQMPARLLRDQRYRLRVVNDDGEQRVLGSYTVTESVVERLPIGSVIIRGDVDDEPVFRAELREGEKPNTSDVRIAYIDQSETTDSLTISIEDDEGNALRETTTETGPFGVYQESLPLDDWDGESSIQVSVDADRGGEITTYDRTLGELENLGDRIAIDDDILQLMGYLSILMLMGLIVIVNPPLAALVGVIWAGLISAVGIVPISGLAIAVAGSVAVLFVAGSGQGGPI